MSGQPYADLFVDIGGTVRLGLQDMWNASQGRSPLATLAYGTTVTPNAAAGRWQLLTVTDGVAFTIAAPTNPPASNQTAELVIGVLNSSGGAMGVITWNAAFVFAGLSWTNPLSTKHRYARFEWNGSNWICTGVAAADY
jgi:hypothetical protein